MLIFHPTSLPEGHGIGDFGKSAYEWLDFLSESGVRIWQVLPLGPTDTSQFSPYSSTSSTLGNFALIDLVYLETIDQIISNQKHLTLRENSLPITHATWTKREATLLETWRDVTQQDVPSPEADLYAYGADSLFVTRFVAIVKRQTGIELGIRDFLEQPTLKGVANRLNKLEKQPTKRKPILRRRTSKPSIPKPSE